MHICVLAKQRCCNGSSLKISNVLENACCYFKYLQNGVLKHTHALRCISPRLRTTILDPFTTINRLHVKLSLGAQESTRLLICRVRRRRQCSCFIAGSWREFVMFILNICLELDSWMAPQWEEDLSHRIWRRLC